jgi:hypothetical protein
VTKQELSKNFPTDHKVFVIQNICNFGLTMPRGHLHLMCSYIIPA